MDRPSMEDSEITRRYKQRLAEKLHPKKTSMAAVQEEDEAEQLDFNDLMNEEH
jgi:hypothetical protein